MGNLNKKVIAAALVATIAVSVPLLTSCEGRKMSNMKPTGETVEVDLSSQLHPDSVPAPDQ